MDGMAIADPRPSLLVTNDDGIDAPGLRFLVDLLVAADRCRVLVCAPDSCQYLKRCHLAVSRIEIEEIVLNCRVLGLRFLEYGD
ncbi:hypothetical protein BHM03_00050360 [Ensete ventricosum]|nr:hypothetical protein BHM03_00050360 [Ensete ventricosum]